MTLVFESEECRVWTGALGTPLHDIEDAEVQDLDVVPFGLRIWLNTQLNTASEDVQSLIQQGLYLVRSLGSAMGVKRAQNSVLLPSDALSCFSLYSPSPFVSSVLVVLDVDDTRQQGYFFGRVRRAMLGEVSGNRMVFSGDQDSDAFYDIDMAEELLAALHAAFPKVQLSSAAKNCLAKRQMSRREAGAKLGEIVKRRKTLSAEAFYGPNTQKPTPLASNLDGHVTDSSWRSFYDKLQFRVSHSLMCQLEGTAPISTSFPRQQEAFEFADQVAALRRRVRAARVISTYIEGEGDSVPRVFSFESAGNGKRRFLVASFASFWKNYKKTRADQRHVYEIIREDVPCRLYFDLEFKRGINPNVDGNALVDRLISLLQLQFYRMYGLCVNHENIYQLDSSTPVKFSRHLIFHLPYGYLFANNLHAGVFVREFISDLVVFGVEKTGQLEGSEGLHSPFLVNAETADDPVAKKQLFIDTGVYTRNRMFRVLGSSKFKKQAFLWPLTASTSASELDQKLFLNTLVCPYPSLDAMKLSQKNNQFLLQCEPSLTAVGRSRSLTTPSTKTLASSSIECRKSAYPVLDAFIRAQSTKGGVQGEIRTIQMLMTTNSACMANLPGHEDNQEQSNAETPQHPWMIIYHMARNRWCANIGRPHKSNNVMFIVDINQRIFYQKCHDRTCQAMDFRSPPQPLPLYIELHAEAGSPTSSS